jgi:glycine/betaine/sarcosine/D-proline reductase family selenoprotein B
VERAGIPTAVITNLVSIAEQVGAPRIVRGGGIPYPAGDPELKPDAERAWRRRLVQRALDVVATPVERPTVFEVPTTNKPEATEAARA